MAVAADRPFSAAFGIWFAASFDLHDIVACEPCADRDAVMIHFLIGDDALQARLRAPTRHQHFSAERS